MRKTITGGFAVLLGIALGMPAPADAQARYAASSTDLAKAQQLEAQAEALYTVPNEYRKAARLHLRAADLRPAGDLERVAGLRQAARLFYYSGAMVDARETMVKAADAAMEAGDVLNAAETYLDAAFLYREAGMQAEMNTLVRKAQLLSNSPFLTARDRDSIRNRIQISA